MFILRTYIIYVSAASALTDSVQKEMVEPMDHTENLRNNVSTALDRHNDHLNEVQEMLNTAVSLSNHTEKLLINIQTNGENFQVKHFPYSQDIFKGTE